MKKAFPEYHRPSEKEFQALWDACLFAPDANVLLNIYGYSEQTREEYLSLLERISPRLRIPHQFALEYHRNRARAVMEQVKNYARVERTLDQVYKEDLLPKNKHPFLDEDMLSAFRKIQRALARSRKKHEELFTTDPYFNRLTAAFHVVGAPMADLEKLVELGRRRYAAKKPPGYADSKDKGEPDCFGDLAGWLQLIEIAKAEQKPVLLITDDAKEDWWLVQNDRTIGPRPELIAEFTQQSGQPFYMYSSAQFLSYANTYLNQKVKAQAIKEVNERIRQQQMRVEKKAESPDPSPLAEDKPYFIPDNPKPEAIKPKAQSDDTPKKKRNA